MFILLSLAVGCNCYICVTEIDECKSNPCLNDGECVNRVAGYVCTCGSFHSGKHCEIGKVRIILLML